MGQKRMVKIGLDLIMTVLLLCQMAYLLIGEEAHEWLGTAMFVLLILHHILNWRWYQNLTKGNYHGVRILQMAVNFLDEPPFGASLGYDYRNGKENMGQTEILFCRNMDLADPGRRYWHFGNL